MKFMVTRTSLLGREKCPVEGAKRERFVRIDERTANDPKKIPAHKGTDGDWYEKGSNHRVEKGHIKRDFEDEAWFVELGSLEDLLNFVDKNGEVVVGWSMWNSGIRSLEIYDDYRE